MHVLKHWLVGLLFSYWCLMSPMALACEATLQLNSISGFVERGTLGSKETYIQTVYSGDDMSYSTLIFSKEEVVNKKSLIQQTAKTMIASVSAATKAFDPQVKILNNAILPKLDSRLAFLIYIDYETEGSINVEASALIRNGSCWSVLRFSALKKETKDEALNQFAKLIRKTQLIS